MRLRKFEVGGLWRNADFMRLWVGETVSLVGSQVTMLALPLTAVVTLGASAAEMGILQAAEYLPFLFVTLPAGVWVDRAHRKPLLVLSNLGRAALVGIVPSLALVGILRIEHLYAIGFLVGVLTVIFHLAYQAYLPSLVAREQLADGNSKMGASESVATLGGPGLAGLLIEVLSAPVALIVDAVSYLASAVGIGAIKTEEPKPAAERKGSVRREISEGLRFTFANRYLRPLAFEAAIYNFFMGAVMAVLFLYAVRSLGLNAGTLGVIFSLGSVGSLLGAMLAERLARRFGLGRTIVVAMVVACLSPMLLPLATGPVWAGAVLGASFALGWGGVAVYNVHIITLRQSITPDRLRGRMNASYRFLTWGVGPLGSLMGGFLGEGLGLYPTLLLGAVGIAVAWVPVLFSPIPRLREMPEVEDGSAEVFEAEKALAA